MQGSEGPLLGHSEISLPNEMPLKPPKRNTTEGLGDSFNVEESGGGGVYILMFKLDVNLAELGKKQDPKVRRKDRD